MVVAQGSRVAVMMVHGSFLLLFSTTQSQEALSQGMLPGCRLMNGSLQCVPGLTTSPEAQIKILDAEIQSDKQSEAVIQQNIVGLNHLLLAGEAEQGAILKTQLHIAADDIDEVHIHWYRKPKTSSQWTLIKNAHGSRYRIKKNDSKNYLMAVVVVKKANGEVVRQTSNVVGPIK